MQGCADFSLLTAELCRIRWGSYSALQTPLLDLSGTWKGQQNTGESGEEGDKGRKGVVGGKDRGEGKEGQRVKRGRRTMGGDGKFRSPVISKTWHPPMNATVFVQHCL